MKNKTIAIASALLMGSILTFNSIAFADTTNTTNTSSSAGVQQKPAAFGQMRGGKMDDFGHKGMRGGQGWGLQLDELVTAGTITQATADKIQAYIDEQAAAAKAEMEKVKAMTAEERKAYFESKKSDTAAKQDLCSVLVEKGIITQAEADAIEAARDTAREAQQAERQAEQKENTEAALDKLVDSGVITAEQADKVIEYMEKIQATRASEMAKLKEMTAEERAAYIKDYSPDKTNLLDQLVTDKVLTQEQADAVQKGLHPNGLSKGPRANMQKSTNTNGAQSL